jgi:hypothetical protein
VVQYSISKPFIFEGSNFASVESVMLQLAIWKVSSREQYYFGGKSFDNEEGDGLKHLTELNTCA